MLISLELVNVSVVSLTLPTECTGVSSEDLDKCCWDAAAQLEHWVAAS
jgi:hypothetical protein